MLEQCHADCITWFNFFVLLSEATLLSQPHSKAEVEDVVYTRKYNTMVTLSCGSICCTCAVDVSACLLGPVCEKVRWFSHLIQSRPLRFPDLSPTISVRKNHQSSQKFRGSSLGPKALQYGLFVMDRHA